MNTVFAVVHKASWWEPGTPNFLDVGDVSAVIGLLALVVGIGATGARWFVKLIRRIMREEIGAATAPIQPHANGGLSLPDIARRTEKLEEQMCRIEQQNIETKDLLVKVLAQAVIIPDTPPADPKPTKTRAKRTA